MAHPRKIRFLLPLLIVLLLLLVGGGGVFAFMHFRDSAESSSISEDRDDRDRKKSRKKDSDEDEDEGQETEGRQQQGCDKVTFHTVCNLLLFDEFFGIAAVGCGDFHNIDAFRKHGYVDFGVGIRF